jgi:AmmeMemoRadiSam system protein B
MRGPRDVRPPAVAGRFYPAQAGELGRVVDELLAEAEPAKERAKALIVPHAGYVYSGPIAATAYAGVAAWGSDIRKVVLLGPAHRVHLEGVAVPSSSAFRTPLGDVTIDRGLVESVLGLPGVVVNDEAHRDEHSLEVQLPFLQRVLGEFTLLPLVVGRASPAVVAQVLERVWGGDDTLVLISSDLSHYHPYADATAIDRQTAAWIVASEQPGLDPGRACGARCIDGVIELARRTPGRFRRELLDLCNSGDTAGSRDQVVGYGAFAIHEVAPC